MHQHEPTEAGAAAPRSSARRRTNDREEIALLKEKMRGAVASLGMPRHVTQAALSLIDTWQRGKGLFPEQATIARGAHYSERRTRDALAELRRTYDLITWDNRRYRGVQTSNLYQWTPRFWALVNARDGGATGGNRCRPQAAKIASRWRQPLPTNGDLPFSERSSLNGIAQGPEALATTATSTAATAPKPSPSPSFSEQQAEGAPAEPSTPHLSTDPAILDLQRLHGERHAEKYGREDARRGEAYQPGAASCLSAKNRPPVATELRNLAARAHALALAKNRDDLTPDALRIELTDRLVCAFFEQETPYLRERKHPLGCLWGQGGTDGKPCALLSLAPRVLEQWAEALEPGDAPTLAEVLSLAPVEANEHQGEPPPLDTADDAAEARAACDELRARAPVALDELDELDAAPDLPELNEARTVEQIRAELERIDADARARAEHPRAQRPRTRRRDRDRVRLAARPRERLALLAALLALAAPPAPPGDLEHEPHDDGPAAAPWTAAAPPLLRDARDRSARRAPRRRRAPPRRT